MGEGLFIHRVVLRRCVYNAVIIVQSTIRNVGTHIPHYEGRAQMWPNLYHILWSYSYVIFVSFLAFWVQLELLTSEMTLILNAACTHFRSKVAFIGEFLLLRVHIKDFALPLSAEFCPSKSDMTNYLIASFEFERQLKPKSLSSPEEVLCLIWLQSIPSAHLPYLI